MENPFAAVDGKTDGEISLFLNMSGIRRPSAIGFKTDDVRHVISIGE